MYIKPRSTKNTQPSKWPRSYSLHGSFGICIAVNYLLRFHKDVWLLTTQSKLDILYIFQLLTVIR